MNIGLNLTLEEVNYILTLLSERPFKECHLVFNKVKSQADADFYKQSAKNKEIFNEKEGE